MFHILLLFSVQSVPVLINNVLDSDKLDVDPDDRATIEICVNLLTELKVAANDGDVDEFSTALQRASKVLKEVVPTIKDPDTKNLLLDISVKVDSERSKFESGDGDASDAKGFISSIEGLLTKFMRGLGKAVEDIVGGVVDFVKGDAGGVVDGINHLLEDTSKGNLIEGVVHGVGDVIGGKLKGLNGALGGLSNGLKALG